MTPIRVLLVDDSPTILRILARSLQADDAEWTILTASNGQEALDRIARDRPDVVVLDVQMPKMSGLEALRELRRSERTLPVIMFSSKTGPSTKATIEALVLGASDYVTKPSTRDSVDVIRAHLIPKIKLLVRRKGGAPVTAPVSPTVSLPASARRSAPASVQSLLPPRRQAHRSRRRGEGVKLLAIGSSTGGPQALEKLLSALPGNLPVPVVVVQHMPATFTSYLAQQLNARCALRVREGSSGISLEAGDVWIAPGGRHMTVRGEHGRTRLLLNDSPPENSCRPAVDVLFRSAAKVYGGGVLAAVLTGMGADGARGAVAIAAAGGQVIAQDKASSVVWGMPRAVIEAGVASRVLPLERIAAALEASISGARAVA